MPPEDLDVQADSQDQSGTGVVEPAETKAPWSDYLNDLPDSVKPLVEPKFKEWDANVTKRFQSVQSEYEPLKPFKQFVDAGLDAETIQQYAQFVEAFNSDPEQVYKAMQEHYGFGSDQGQGIQPDAQQNQTTDDGEYDPRFLQLEQNQQLLADIITAQHEAEVAAKLDEELNKELATAKEKHGDFDETVVLGWCAANPSMTIDQAAENYNKTIEAALAKRQAPQVPTIMGGGGSLPSQSVDPAKLPSKDRKALVAQWLANSAAET